MTDTAEAGGLLPPLRRAAAATIITAGPWLVSVAALALISLTMLPVMGKDAVQDLRLTVVYAVCIAPLVAGPLGAIAAQQMLAAIEAGRSRLVTEIFLAACLIAGLGSLLLATGIGLLLDLQPLPIRIGFLFLAIAVALLWICFAALTALRDFAFLMMVFATGMMFSIICCILAARDSPTTEQMVWSFTAGVVLCVSLTMRHVCLLFGRGRDLWSTTRLLMAAVARARLLALGIAAGICAVWIDKWTFWFSSAGEVSAAGLRHFGDYDSVMFLAHLAIIPSLAAMHMMHERTIKPAVAEVRRTIAEGSTHAVIRDAVADLVESVWSGAFRIFFLQGILTAVFVMLAPWLVVAMDFSFDQFFMLQVGIISTFLYSFVYICSSVLMICGRTDQFLRVQAIFLSLNAVLSILCLFLFDVTAYSFFISSLVAAAVAFFAAYRSLSQYDFLIFVRRSD